MRRSPDEVAKRAHAGGLLLQTYDRYLRRKAEEAAGSRDTAAMKWVVLPWVAAAGLLPVLGQELSAPRWFLLGVAAPLSVLLIASGMAVGFRFAGHAARFDRSPAPAPWTETDNGRRIVEALRRTTLRGLRDVTLDTELRRDLRLSDFEISGLIQDLAETGRSSLQAYPWRGARELTIGMLFERMSAPMDMGQ